MTRRAVLFAASAAFGLALVAGEGRAEPRALKCIAGGAPVWICKPFSG